MNRIILFLFFWIIAGAAPAQDISFLLKEGEQLEAQKNDNEALRKYQEAIQLSPTDVKALCKISEVNSVLGSRQSDKKSKQEYFTAALMYAERAIKSNEKSPQANFVMALAKAKMSEVSSPREKIQFVREIKSFADRALLEDSSYYPALHLLGKWHAEVSALGGAEKAAIKLFGGLPQASLPEAIALFEKVRRLRPSFVLNYLDLAKAYKSNGSSDKAIEILNRLVKLAPKTVDDEAYKAEGRKMLESLL